MSERDLARFLRALYPVDSPGWLVLFTLPGDHAHWTRPTELERIVGRAAILDRAHNVYFGVGLHERALGPAHKGKADTVSVLPAFWLDADIAGPEKRKPYPPSQAWLEAMLARLPLTPSIIVTTGGGLHAYWLLREPWELETGDERGRAATIAGGWQAFIRAMVARDGYALDSTANLDRVLRLPGTHNHKHQPPRLVELLTLEDGRRYNPSDFEPYLVEAPTTTAALLPSRLTLRAGALPPGDQLAALLRSPKARATFARTRTDLADTSPSGWDLALATIAALAGWEPQPIADLLLAARRLHGDELKLERVDYYERTIAKALATAAERRLPDTSPDDGHQGRPTAVQSRTDFRRWGPVGKAVW